MEDTPQTVEERGLEFESAPEEVVVYKTRWDDYPRMIHRTFDRYPYVGLHSKCLDMMKRLVDYRKTLIARGLSVDGPKTLSRFYEIYEARISGGYPEPHLFNAGLDHFPDFSLRVFEPHGYYFRVEKLIDNDFWPIGRADVVAYEVAPFPIRDLTHAILKYLQPLVPERRAASNTESKSHQMIPGQLQEQIVDDFHPFIDRDIQRTCELSPTIWRELLFQGQLLPWLWDLDPAILQGRPPTLAGNDAQTYATEDIWDWEQLVRQLAPPDAFEPGNLMENAPLRLRNRRRIWRLLDEARLRTTQVNEAYL